MKLRTTHNSIRIRLRKSEIVTLAKKRYVEEGIRFPGGTAFMFSLRAEDNIESVTATLHDGLVTILLPYKMAHAWMSTDQVGIESYIKVDNETQLHVLVEKDFPCLDRDQEDKSDTFWELAQEKPDTC